MRDSEKKNKKKEKSAAKPTPHMNEGKYHALILTHPIKATRRERKKHKHAHQDSTHPQTHNRYIHFN